VKALLLTAWLYAREFYVFIQNGQHFVFLTWGYGEYDPLYARFPKMVDDLLIRISVYDE